MDRVRIYNDKLSHKISKKNTQMVSLICGKYPIICMYVCEQRHMCTGQYVKKKIVSIRLKIRYEKGLNASNGHKLQMKIQNCFSSSNPVMYLSLLTKDMCTNKYVIMKI